MNAKNALFIYIFAFYPTIMMTLIVVFNTNLVRITRCHKRGMVQVAKVYGFPGFWKIRITFYL